MSNTVNHPDHYKGKRFEAIDIIEDYELDFCLGNAVKYILRCGKKGDAIEDLRKAKWYIEYEICKRLNEKQIEKENKVVVKECANCKHFNPNVVCCKINPNYNISRTTVCTNWEAQ